MKLFCFVVIVLFERIQQTCKSVNEINVSLVKFVASFQAVSEKKTSTKIIIIITKLIKYDFCSILLLLL